MARRLLLLSTQFAFSLLHLLTASAADHRRPPAPQESFAPYWTAEPGWSTEFQLKNNLAASSLTITPVLRLADGREIALDAVTVPSNDVVSVEVGEALARQAPELVGSAQLYGSVVFRYTSRHARNLYAAVMIHMHGQPIGYHVDAFPVFSEAQAGSREGIWWQPHAGLTDVLVFSNSSDTPINGILSLFDAAGKRWSEPLPLATHQTRRMSVGDLVRSSGLAGTYGGIKYEAPANAPAVDSVHVLYEETAGFSAMMKMFYRDPGAKVEERTWAGNQQWTMWAPMLALRSPDPAAGFPPGTVLEPTIFLYNPTRKHVPAGITLTWRGEAARGTVTLPAMLLKPFETKRLAIGAMQKLLGIPDDAHWALVTLRSPASPDDLIAVAASYDATGRYGAQTPFSDQLSGHWVGGQWQVDATHNTVAAVTNGGTRATEALVTLHYNNGSAKYEIQRTLQPGEQMWLNFGELIHNNIPDRKGHTLPAALTSGTYDIKDLNPGLGGNLFEGKVILDKTYGHLAYGCVQCCGYSDPFLMQDPTDVIVNASQPLDAWGNNDCDGFDYNLDGDYRSGTWWSGNGSIASVTSLQVRGVSSGSTNGFANAPIPVTQGQRCPMLPRQAQNTDQVHSLDHFTVSVTSTPVTGETNSMVSGQAANIQVKAIDSSGQILSAYRGTVHFSSTDTTASLPADYTFTTADAGTHTFSATLVSVAGTSSTRDLKVSAPSWAPLLPKTSMCGSM